MQPKPDPPIDRRQAQHGGRLRPAAYQEHADSLLSMFSGKLPYHVAPSSNIGQIRVSDANRPDNYNNGRLTSGCSGQRGQPDQPARLFHRRADF
jgi:hypothetical protein